MTADRRVRSGTRAAARVTASRRVRSGHGWGGGGAVITGHRVRSGHGRGVAAHSESDRQDGGPTFHTVLQDGTYNTGGEGECDADPPATTQQSRVA